MTDVITATRAQLVAALKRWESDATAGSWPERSDEARHGDSADYLIALVHQMQS